MTITWGRLRGHSDGNKQTAGTGADDHGSHASEKRRERLEKRVERQRIRREVQRERSAEDPLAPRAMDGFGVGGGSL
jgi:hypothetical protein